MATKTVSKKKQVKEKVTPVAATGEQCFWSTDGQILATLFDLNAALNAMAKETYQYHVSGDKNDFADWVEYVLCDQACAEGLRKAKTHKGAITVVTKRIAYYA